MLSDGVGGNAAFDLIPFHTEIAVEASPSFSGSHPFIPSRGQQVSRLEHSASPKGFLRHKLCNRNHLYH